MIKIKIERLKFLALVAMLGVFTSCDKQEVLGEQHDDTSSFYRQTRSVEEIKEIANVYLNTSSNLRVSSNLNVEVLRLSELLHIDRVQNLRINSSIDTLIYFVDNPNDNQGGLLLSANRDCSSLLAIMDNSEFSFDKILNHKEQNLGILSFLLTAVEYNLDPALFEQIGFRDYKNVRLNNTIVEEVIPKVKVEWGQSGAPYNKYHRMDGQLVAWLLQ